MCECYAVIDSNDPRYEIWIRVDPQARIPLKHPVPHRHPHFKGVLFYEGDPSRLTEEQKKLIVELMSEKFHEPKSHIREGLDKGILPVRTDNVITIICDFHVRCMQLGETVS